MKKPELYQKTVGILVDAYFNDTLKNSDPCGCAVGNMIAANMGYRVKQSMWGLSWDSIDLPYWTSVFCTNGRKQEWNTENYVDNAKDQIDSTGYSVTELAAIEHAFERASWVGDRMFNSLMAVVEVLDRIHENTDTEITASSKNRFQKQTA